MNQSYQLQMQALREALERSARATLLAEEHTVRALSDLSSERMRVRELEKELSRLTQRHADVLLENRRLRVLVGQACQDRTMMNSDLMTLLHELQNPGAAGRLDLPEEERRRDVA